MCDACLNIHNPQIQEIYKQNAPYNKATHVVEGYTCISGGVIGTALDEFTAHRIAKVFTKFGFSFVKVKENTKENHEEIKKNLKEIFEV